MLAYTAYLSGLYSVLVILVYFRSLEADQTKNALDLGFLIMICGFIGARLFHVLYESPEYYKENWLRVFQIWSGGFVFYGGALTAFIGCLLLLKHRGLDWREWGDFYAPIVAAGYGFGRISCWLAGCCYGRTCDLPWAIDHRHPTQLYAVAWELGVVLCLLLLEYFIRAKKHFALSVVVSRPGQVFYIWVILHATGRLMMEYFRGDFRGSLWLGQSVSTWISFGLFVIASFGLIRNSLSPEPETKGKPAAEA